MRIGELAEKYWVTKREIDYWTTLHLIPCKVDPTNSYRDYGPDAEEAIMKIIVCKTIGLPLNAETIHNFDIMVENPIWVKGAKQAINLEERRLFKAYTYLIRLSHKKDHHADDSKGN